MIIPMTRYVVGIRAYGRTRPMQRFLTLRDAAAYIRREGIGYHPEDSQIGVRPRNPGYGRWNVEAQDGNRITADTPYRPLRAHEHRAPIRALWPEEEAT
jgi:hypothetical protein